MRPLPTCPTCGHVLAPARAPLTTRQADVLGAIQSAIATRGCAPSLTELASMCGLAPSTVYEHLLKLEARGYIQRARGVRQGITVLVMAEMAVTQ